MNYKILRPLSKALEKIITLDELRVEIGLKGLSDIGTIQKYLKASDNEILLTELINADEESFFVINDDVQINDHIVIGIKSKLIETESNIVFFLLPAVLQYKVESNNQVNDLKVFFSDSKQKEEFKKAFDFCYLKCELLDYTRNEYAKNQNLN